MGGDCVIVARVKKVPTVWKKGTWTDGLSLFFAVRRMIFTTASQASLATSIAMGHATGIGKKVMLELFLSRLSGGSLVIVVAIAYIGIAHYFIDVRCFIGRWAARGSW
jgi:hypothetical protein